MAAADKIYCKYYSDYYAFKKWIEKYRPSLLESFILYDSQQQWEDIIENSHNEDLLVCYFPYHLTKWLLWRCPVSIIREELEERGYKTKWHHKLFFKY